MLPAIINFMNECYMSKSDSLFQPPKPPASIISLSVIMCNYMPLLHVVLFLVFVVVVFHYAMLIV